MIILFLLLFCFPVSADEVQYQAQIDMPQFNIQAGDMVTKLPGGAYQLDRDHEWVIAGDEIETDTMTFVLQ